MAMRDFIPFGWGTKAAVAAPIASGSTPYHFLAQTGREILPHEAWNLYKSVSTFAIVVDMIADQVSSMNTITEINGRPVDNHKLDEILNRPGFNRTRRHLVKELTVQHLVTGTGYVNLIGNLRHMPVAVDTYLTKHITPVTMMPPALCAPARLVRMSCLIASAVSGVSFSLYARTPDRDAPRFIRFTLCCSDDSFKSTSARTACKRDKPRPFVSPDIS